MQDNTFYIPLHNLFAYLHTNINDLREVVYDIIIFWVCFKCIVIFIASKGFHLKEKKRNIVFQNYWLWFLVDTR